MKKIFRKTIVYAILLLPFVSKAASSAISIPEEASGLPKSSVEDILTNLLEWLLGIFGIVALIGFVVSGIMYLVSSGDDDTMQKAKKAMTYSIIGVIVGLAGFIIIRAVEAMLWGYDDQF